MAGRKYMRVGSAEKAELLTRHSTVIRKAWLTRLSTYPEGVGRRRVDEIKKDISKKKDLLSILIKQLAGKVKDKEKELRFVLDKVESKNYSVSDLSSQIICLENAVEDTLRHSKEIKENQVDGVVIHVRKLLESFFYSVVQQTTAVYEKIVLSGARGFCLFDTKGRITSTNETMDHLLGTRASVGKYIGPFLDATGQAAVFNVISSKKGAKARISMTMVHQQGGHMIPIGAELGPLFIQGERRGGYLCTVDLTEPTRKEKAILDLCPLGACKLTQQDGKFTYMNPALLRILNTENYEGRTLRDVFPDKKNYAIVRAELERRKKFLSDEYDVTGTRWTDHKQIPIRITAFPELDIQAKPMGSMAFVRDMTVGMAREDIHAFITDSKRVKDELVKRKMNLADIFSRDLSLSEDTAAVLTATAARLEDVIPFNLFIVTKYSEDMAHLRQFYSFHKDGLKIGSDVRWWQLSAPLKKQLLKDMKTQTVTHIGSFRQYFKEKKHERFRNLPEYRWILEQGFKSSMTRFVARENKLISSINFLSKTEGEYGGDQARLADALPLDKAVLMALQYEEQKMTDQRLSLLQELVSEKCKTVDDVARIIVEGLSVGHVWENISIFTVDEDTGYFHLNHQKTLGRVAPLPEDYKQLLKEGVLGCAYRSKKPIIIHDISKDLKYKDIYISSIRNMQSEICLPIVVAGKVRWLMNIEDSHKNAFSDEEVKDLLEIVQQISTLLDRLWIRFSLSATRERASDIIFTTTRNGYIVEPNPAALNELEYNQGEIKNVHVKTIFADPETARATLDAASIVNKEVNLIRKDGRTFPVLMSASPLPKEFGGKIFICKDLSVYKRVEELEFHKNMYQEIAVQTQAPLSLACSWIQRLQKTIQERESVDTLDKTIKQLRKIEMTYNRLIQYEKLPFNPILIDIREIIDHILNAFPESDAGRIVKHVDEDIPYLKGDLFQLNFCFETIFSYLLRYLPPEEKIRLKVSKRKDRVMTQITGYLPNADDLKSENIEQRFAVTRTLVQMALGDELITSSIRKHGGTFNRRRGEKYEELFEIGLPAAR
jgi:PAS domain S-box-containing protein